jgi:glycosyltransferase involved in cell wall biosynthesis
MAGSGKGPECTECLDLMEQLGSKVTNHEFISHERLAGLMRKAHVQVLPSFFEGLPLVLFEGLASGCRIITTQLSGFDEIFGKARSDTIDLIPLPTLKSIDTPHQKDEAYLENALSGSILNMIAIVKKNPDFDDEQAEQIASGYTWSHIFYKTRSVYHEVVGHKILSTSQGKNP